MIAIDWIGLASLVHTHTLPAIHCLMTDNYEDLYTAVILNIKDIIPQLQPTRVTSDWEKKDHEMLLGMLIQELESTYVGSIILKLFGERYKSVD